MSKEWGPLPLGASLSHVQAGLPTLLMQPQEKAGSWQQDKGKGFSHVWSCGTEQRSCVPWKCLPVQVVGAVPCNNSYRHVKDFVVLELEEKNA